MEPKETIIRGTPPLSLVPAKNYVFKINKENYMIRMPRKGEYHKIAPDIFDEASGEFNIFDDESKTILLPDITKVLFAVHKYPKLEDNQLFVPYALTFEDEDLVITGQVVELMMQENDTESEDRDEKEES